MEINWILPSLQSFFSGDISICNVKEYGVRMLGKNRRLRFFFNKKKKKKIIFFQQSRKNEKNDVRLLLGLLVIKKEKE